MPVKKGRPTKFGPLFISKWHVGDSLSKIAWHSMRNHWHKDATCFKTFVHVSAWCLMQPMSLVQRQGSDRRFSLAVIALAALVLPSLCLNVCICLHFVCRSERWDDGMWQMGHDHILTESTWPVFLPGRGSQPWKFGVARISAKCTRGISETLLHLYRPEKPPVKA